MNERESTRPSIAKSPCQTIPHLFHGQVFVKAHSDDGGDEDGESEEELVAGAEEPGEVLGGDFVDYGKR